MQHVDTFIHCQVITLMLTEITESTNKWDQIIHQC